MALLGSVEYRVFDLHTPNQYLFVWLSSGVWNIVYSISILVKPRIIQMCLYGSPRECGISCIRSPYLSNHRIIQMCLYGSWECGISCTISILVKPRIIQMCLYGSPRELEYGVFHLHTCQTKDNTNVFVWLSSGVWSLHTCQTKDNTNVFVWLSSGVWNIVYSISILVKPRIIQMCFYGFGSMEYRVFDLHTQTKEYKCVCMALLGSVEYRVFHLHTCQTKDNTNVFVWLSRVWNICIRSPYSNQGVQMCLYGSPREYGISCIRSPYLSNQG